ncbi:MAG TPA: sugar nucleotide-binding protein, partial [Gemmatimonadaceae bacterium]|nr:sugar nucleotide-binding protein [Gemmatimonadaceae bacterium]
MKTKRAVVFGAGGQIGREAVRALTAAGYHTRGLDRAQCDVTDPRSVDAALAELGEGDVALNAAAYNDVART